MSSLLLLIPFLSWPVCSQRPPELHIRSAGRLYQYEEIALEQGFKSLDPCAADCLFKPCYGNSTCEATKHSVEFKLGCIASACICDATRFRKEAETYIPTCVQEYCDNNQTLASAALEVLKTFCLIPSLTLILSDTISPANWDTSTTSMPTISPKPVCNTDTITGSISTQNGSFIPAFSTIMPGCTTPWSPPESTETSKAPGDPPRGLTSTGRRTLIGICTGAAVLTALNGGVIWYIWYR